MDTTQAVGVLEEVKKDRNKNRRLKVALTILLIILLWTCVVFTMYYVTRVAVRHEIIHTLKCTNVVVEDYVCKKEVDVDRANKIL